MRLLISSIFLVALISTSVFVTLSDIVSPPTRIGIDFNPSEAYEKYGNVSEVKIEPTGHQKHTIDEETSKAVSQSSESRIKRIAASSDMQEILEEKFALEAELKVSQDALYSLRDAIHDEKTTPRARLAFIHSLGTSGLADGEKLISQLAADPNTPEHLRVQSITTLAELENPSGETISLLRNLGLAEDNSTEEVKNAALLNYGSLASTIKDSNPAYSRKIADDLIARATSLFNVSSIPPEKLTLTIEAIANSGSERALPLARNLTNNENASYRSLGATVLRNVATRDAETLLLGLLAQDPTPEVRQASIEALLFRKHSMDSVAAVSSLVHNEESPQVRRDMIKFLAADISFSPEAKKSLESLLTTESDKENYELLVQSLYS